MALPKDRTTETMSVSEARRNFSDVVTRSLRGEGRVIVEKSGTPVGAIVSIEDLRRLERMEKDRAERMEDLRRALKITREEFRDIPKDEIEREIEKAIHEVDVERRGDPVPTERR